MSEDPDWYCEDCQVYKEQIQELNGVISELNSKIGVAFNRVKELKSEIISRAEDIMRVL
jgi:hypothetical protein